jgi:hypothetical protein
MTKLPCRQNADRAAREDREAPAAREVLLRADLTAAHRLPVVAPEVLLPAGLGAARRLPVTLAVRVVLLLALAPAGLAGLVALDEAARRQNR